MMAAEQVNGTCVTSLTMEEQQTQVVTPERIRFTRLKRPSETSSDDNLFVPVAMDVATIDGMTGSRNYRTPSIVDGLLHEIYDKLHMHRRAFAADSDTYTDTTDARLVTVDGRRRSSSGCDIRLQKGALQNTGVTQLEQLRRRCEEQVNHVASELVRQLKRRDRLLNRRDRNYDVITAVLQAASPKRRVDTRMRFSVEPFPGDSGFAQWHDAMRMVARLPGGIPGEFRKRLWLTMADKHVQHRQVDWERVRRFCFNERSNPDDNELGVQIVKDLHRTGCSLFCGDDAEHNQALLKRVLLAFARWNKTVGYCQGFNMLAALILEVMEWREEDALKVMIYLIEGVLPESYFANNLRGLSVDMAVFRDLLRMRLAPLSRHLDHLQLEARDSVSGTSYEPPLTNVFTMQWFLTLFSNCLPKATVLRVWDLIFLEGNEVLLRTALTIWDGLADRIMAVDSADEFYSIMGVLTREMLEFGLMDANHLVKTICTMAPFPFPQLRELRDKYTYNITPFAAAAAAAMGGVARRGLRLFYSDDEDDNNEDEQLAVAAWCFASVFPPQLSPIRAARIGGERSPSPSSSAANFTAIGPGAYGGGAVVAFPDPCRHDAERTSLDISALKKQYAKLRERQKQAHIILTAASSRQQAAAAAAAANKPLPIAVNHLLVGKKPLISRRNSLGLIRFQFKPTTPSGGGAKRVASHTNIASAAAATATSVTSATKRTTAAALLSQLNYKNNNNNNENRKNSLPTPESGETLHWKDAAKQRRQRPPPTTTVAPLPPALSSTGRRSDDDDDDGDRSSSSTELCDEDAGRISDLASDLEDDETARKPPARAGNVPAVVVSIGDRTSGGNKGDNAATTTDSKPEEDESGGSGHLVVEASSGGNGGGVGTTRLSVSKWIDSFDKGLVDSEHFQVVGIVDSGGAIVELTTQSDRKCSISGSSSSNDDAATATDDYSAEKRDEWLAKLDMYRRTLGVDCAVAVDDDQRTSTSDEFHSLTDSAPPSDAEQSGPKRPSVLNLPTPPSPPNDADKPCDASAAAATAPPAESTGRVKRYFDQSSPIRNVPTAYIPGERSSIITDLSGVSGGGGATIAVTLPSPKSPTLFNPFPTARKSQLWGNSEVGVRLGLYENSTKVGNKK